MNRVNLIDVMYYGRYYNSSNYNFDVRWWFCTIDYKILSTEDLLNDYGFFEYEEIKLNDNYIPVFRTDIEKLQKIFLQNNFMNEKIKCLCENDDCGTAFRIFIDDKLDLKRQWIEFEKEHLYIDAIKWCKMHGIPYR